RKALQDLTNASIQYPKTLEEKSARPSRRGIPTICYKEPHLNSKLRRGDKFTDTQFLNSPVKRVEIKRNFKSKSKF
ncbi:SGO1 protein, partial [Baryphthengus martii]|nr:SGO1 protein [Baryphthengus martii]